MKNIDQISQIKDNHANKILALPGVNAIGLGYIGGQQNEENIGIIVYLDDPTEPHQVPETLEGIEVEIREGHFSSPFATLTEQEPSQPPAAAKPKTGLGNPRDVEFEPMIGGIGVNPDFFYFSSWSGTLGLAIWDKNKNAVILSNRHVICGKKPVVGDGVSQPVYEFLSHLAARLVAWNQGDITYQGKKYGIDAAIALPTNNRKASVGKIYGLPDVAGTATAILGMNVTKSGLTTNVTTGTVTGINVDCIEKDSAIVMSNQIIIKSSTTGSFSESGDSGSAVIEIGTNKVTGLLWGGNEKLKETMCSPIEAVLDYFECTI